MDSLFRSALPRAKMSFISGINVFSMVSMIPDKRDSMASVKGKELTTSIRPSATPMKINYDVVNASHFGPN